MTSSSETSRSTGDVVKSGIGWGIALAFTLPVAAVLLALAPDGLSSAGGSGTTQKAPKPRRRLQYWITAVTVTVLYLPIAAYFAHRWYIKNF